MSEQARSFFEAPARLIDSISRGKVTPNMISIFSLLVLLPVAWLISQCYLGYGGLLLLLLAPLDLLDGALARVQKRVSKFGTVLDASLDRAKEILVYSALAYHFAGQYDRTGVMLTIIALGLSILVSYIKAKTEMASDKKDVAKLNRMYATGLFRFEVRVLLLGLGLIFGFTEGALIAIIAGAGLTALERLYTAWKVLK